MHLFSYIANSGRLPITDTRTLTLTKPSSTTAPSEDAAARKRRRHDTNGSRHDPLFESELRFLSEAPVMAPIHPPSATGFRYRSREAFINFCEREHSFLRRIDASCCLLIICWIYTKRLRFKTSDYTLLSIYLCLHLACAFHEDDEAQRELILHRVIKNPPRHPFYAHDEDGSGSPPHTRYPERKEDPHATFFDPEVPQNWSFDRKDLREYLNRVKDFFRLRDGMLRLLNYNMYVTLEECASEMQDFPKCGLFYLDPTSEDESDSEKAAEE